MSKVIDKKELMRKSIRRACGKERFAGFLYFLGTLVMSIAVFFTLLDNVIYVNNGNLNVTTFWTPLVEVFDVQFSVVAIGMDFAVAVVYLLTLLICVVNTIRALAKLDALYIRGNRKIGFNQNGIAMDKLGKIFSRTFVAIAFYMYFTHMFIGAEPTLLFYAVTVLFLIIHFWAGIVGAKASRFTVKDEDGIKELPRTKGRLAPFFRNVMQFVFLAGLLYFMSKANIINNLLVIFDGQAMKDMFGNLRANFGTFITRFVTPLLQLLICLGMWALVVHATDTTEWNRKGSKGKGMKNCRVFTMLVFLAALAYNVFHLYLALQHGKTALSMQMIYVAVIALAWFIEECCMAKLPNDKTAVVEDPLAFMDEQKTEEKEEGLEKIEVLPGKYKYVDSPAVYMQPNGKPIMVMPMMTVEEEEKVVEAKAEKGENKVYATPVGENALAMEEYRNAVKGQWMDRAKGEPTDEEFNTQPLKAPSKEADVMELGADKKVKCPHCGSIVWAKEGAPAYICPDCNEKFSFPANK